MMGFRRFLQDERGAETIEFVVWIPAIAMLLVLVTDGSMLYLTHTEMWNVARDTARRMTMGAIGSEAAAESYAINQLAYYDYPFLVDANYNPDGVMSVTLEVDIDDVSTFGFFLGPVLGDSMRATVIMRPDPIIAALAAGGGSSGGPGNSNPGNSDPGDSGPGTPGKGPKK